MENKKLIFCPYCRSTDTTTLVINEFAGERDITYECHACKKTFEIKDKTFKPYYDPTLDLCPKRTKNLPSYITEHKKFENMGVVPKRNIKNMTDLWIDLWELLEKE